MPIPTESVSEDYGMRLEQFNCHYICSIEIVKKLILSFIEVKSVGYSAQIQQYHREIIVKFYTFLYLPLLRILQKRTHIKRLAND